MKATCGLLVLVGGLVLATPAGAAGVKPEEAEEEVVKKAAEGVAADPQRQEQPWLTEEEAARDAQVAREERGRAAEQARLEREGPDRTYRPLPTNRMFRASEKRRREQARAEGLAAAERGGEVPPSDDAAAAAAAAAVVATSAGPRPSGWLVFAGVALAVGMAAVVALNELG